MRLRSRAASTSSAHAASDVQLKIASRPASAGKESEDTQSTLAPLPRRRVRAPSGRPQTATCTPIGRAPNVDAHSRPRSYCSRVADTGSVACSRCDSSRRRRCPPARKRPTACRSRAACRCFRARRQTPSRGPSPRRAPASTAFRPRRHTRGRIQIHRVVPVHFVACRAARAPRTEACCFGNAYAMPAMEARRVLKGTSHSMYTAAAGRFTWQRRYLPPSPQTALRGLAKRRLCRRPGEAHRADDVALTSALT